MASPERPSITAILPVYNAARYLDEAMQCLLRQTCPASQILVVDDGSTDDTLKLLEKYGDPVRVLRQGRNSGPGAARNRALAEATGRYVAFQDADDVCVPDRFERQIAALSKTPAAIACLTGFWRFDESGRLNEQRAEDGVLHPDSLDLLSECQWHPATMMFDRSRAADLRCAEDRIVGTDMIFTALLSKRGPFVSLPEPLYGYRAHPHQLTIGHRGSQSESRFFQGRYDWARAHWREHWPERSWEEVEQKLWDGHVRQTEAAYWARNKRYFLYDREFLRRRWPSHLPKPAVLGWRWYPDWIWKAKERFDNWRRQTQ
jgi:glycosyltransferase involved in cell wall biosynthesis